MTHSSYSIAEVQLRTWPHYRNHSAGLKSRSLPRHPRVGRPLCLSWQVWSSQALRGLACPLAKSNLGPRAHSHDSCSVKAQGRLRQTGNTSTPVDLKAVSPSPGTLSCPLADVGLLPRNVDFEKPFLCKLTLGSCSLDLESDRGVLFLAWSFTPSINMHKSGLAASPYMVRGESSQRRGWFSASN